VPVYVKHEEKSSVPVVYKSRYTAIFFFIEGVFVFSTEEQHCLIWIGNKNCTTNAASGRNFGRLSLTFFSSVCYNVVSHVYSRTWKAWTGCHIWRSLISPFKAVIPLQTNSTENVDFSIRRILSLTSIFAMPRGKWKMGRLNGSGLR
jgi:hypothetical protein